MDQPIYIHDCDVCHYLGTDTTYPGEPRCNGVDLYVHKTNPNPADWTLIRRYSSDGPDYSSALLSWAGPHYAKAKMLVGAMILDPLKGKQGGLTFPLIYAILGS